MRWSWRRLVAVEKVMELVVTELVMAVKVIEVVVVELVMG